MSIFLKIVSSKVTYLTDILKRKGLLSEKTQFSLSEKLAEAYEKCAQFSDARKTYYNLGILDGVVRAYFREQRNNLFRRGISYKDIRDLSFDSDYTFREISEKSDNSLNMSHKINAISTNIYQFVEKHREKVTDPEQLKKLKAEAVKSILDLPRITGETMDRFGEDYGNGYAYLEGKTLEYLKQLGGVKAVKLAALRNAQLAEKIVGKAKFRRINGEYDDRAYYCGKLEAYECSEYRLDRAQRYDCAADKYDLAGESDKAGELREKALKELESVSASTRKMSNYKGWAYSFDGIVKGIVGLEKKLKNKLAGELTNGN